ncbi:MAG: hypothetical protein IPO18_06365 [bacterium]|nr:hypothetical protein [bacterium]
MDLEIDLGFGVSTIDSVWIDITGTSAIGTNTVCFGMGTTGTIGCRDLVFLSFIDEPSQGTCPDGVVSPDGIMDCIAGSFMSSGVAAPFAESVHLAGVERTQYWLPAFGVVEPRPQWGDLFLDGHATLRIREIDALGGFGCSGPRPCEGGLADITAVTVHVAYDSALAAQLTTWGTVKACYR